MVVKLTCAFNSPGENIAPPRMTYPPKIMPNVIRAVTNALGDKQPSRLVFIVYLPVLAQKSGIIYRRADMNKSCCKQRHANWNVHSVPYPQ